MIFRGRAALAACAASVAATVALERLGSDAYASVLGIQHPVPVSVVVAALGYVGLRALVKRSWVASRAQGRDGWVLAASIGSLLPIPVIVVDCLGGFGRELNASLPGALLFYPSVGVMAELTFHVMPLAVAALAGSVWETAERGLERTGFAVAVSVEAILQVVWGAGSSPWWASAYVGPHLLAVNVVAVYLLRRHGFLCACAFRLSYYAVWHLAWGSLRLDLLFAP